MCTATCRGPLVSYQSTGLIPSRLNLPPVDWFAPQSTDPGLQLTDTGHQSTDPAAQSPVQHHGSRLSSTSFSKAPTSRPFLISSSANILRASKRPQIPALEITQHLLGVIAVPAKIPTLCVYKVKQPCRPVLSKHPSRKCR